MAFSRTAALRACIRGARPTVARPQLWRQVARRGYASGGHGSATGSGDAIWGAAAVVVTLPTCWYILKDSPSSHGHGGHDGDHGDSHGDEHEEKPTDDVESEGKPDKEPTDGSKESKKSEDSDSEDEKKDTPDTSDDEGKDDDNSQKVDETGNVRKDVPDAKGGAKKRIESAKGIKQGEATDDDEGGDKAAASKPAEGKNSQSGKQEGLTNTDTKHSTDISNDSSKSKKGEGMPETAKSKGTVDPKRPQV